MTGEFVMVPCPVCQRERRLPITTRYSVWKMWSRQCIYCQTPYKEQILWVSLLNDAKTRATA